MYDLELQMVEKRWCRRDKYDHELKKYITSGLYTLGGIVLVTAILPGSDFKAVLVQVIVLLINVYFGKWLVEKGG